jgi:PAS domain S-box-containing protein
MNFYLWLPLLAFVLNTVLATLVFIKHRHTSVHRLFLLFLVSMALWCITIFGMRASSDLEHALLWERVVIVMICGTSVFFYHFTLLLTGIKSQRGVLFAAYLYLLFIVSIAPTSLALTGMQMEPYGYAPIPGAFFFLPGVLGVYSFAILGLINLIRACRVATDHKVRNQYLYILYGVGVSLAGGVFDLLPVLGLPSYPGAIIGNATFAMFATLAILKYNLLDIRIVIRKSLAYVLISATVAIPYVFILVLLNQVLKTKIELWWAYASIILLLAIFLRPLYSWTQNFVDRLFYRDRYEYLRALEQFSQRAQSVMNLKELSSTLTRLVSSALRASSACLLLPSESDNGLIIVSSTGLGSPSSGVVLRHRSPLIKWLKLQQRILSSEELNIVPQLQSLSLREKNNLEQMEAKLYVSIQTGPGQLSGILVLGQKLSQQPYSSEDRQLLTALSSQMAIALENARLYNESQKEVSERKRAEQALRGSEEKYRGLVTNVKVGVFRSTPGPTGRFLEVNPAMEEITGYSREELLRMNVSDLYVHPEEREAILAEITSATGKVTKELHLGKKDGTEIVVSDTKVAVRDNAGKIIYFDGIMEDITEHKRAREEEQRLQQELYLSRRLASIGELAAGVAHEINNPLTGILGFSQRLSRRSANEEFSRDLEIIHSEAQRAARVVQNLLTFARRREPKKEYSNINDILQKALELRAYELKTSNIEVVTDLASSLPEIMVDFPQIQEVFLNIILNAEQAMTETHSGGKLTIRDRQIKDHIRISFTDDGPGIPPEHLDKVFDPFFTTRAEKGGTGLGLSACHGIVTEHGGMIYVRSKPGKGATFFVELPVITEK